MRIGLLMQIIDSKLRGRNFFDGDINYNALPNFDGSAHLVTSEYIPTPTAMPPACSFAALIWRYARHRLILYNFCLRRGAAWIARGLTNMKVRA